jgi:hypothetical protein
VKAYTAPNILQKLDEIARMIINRLKQTKRQQQIKIIVHNQMAIAAATNLDKRTTAAPIRSKEPAENGWYIV